MGSPGEGSHGLSGRRVIWVVWETGHMGSPEDGSHG